MYGIYALYGRSRYINNYETYIISMYVLCACADCHNNKSIRVESTKVKEKFLQNVKV